jgi:hypothetical protein
MRPARQHLEHPSRVALILRFTKDPIVNDHRSVGTKHDTAGHSAVNRERLRFGNSLHVPFGNLATLNRFVNVRRFDVERNARSPQQFRTPRRC